MFPPHFKVFWVILGLSASLSGCQPLENANLPFFPAPTPSPEIRPILADATTLMTLERELYRQVNQYRRSRQLPPLTLHPAITQQARLHSERMAAKTIEVGNVDFDNRVKTLAITLKVEKAAENIAVHPGYEDPVPSVLQGWVSSMTERQHLEGDYNATGIGITQNLAGEYYITQIFVRESPNLLIQSPKIASPQPWPLNDPFLQPKAANNNNNAYLFGLEQEIHRQVNQYRLSQKLPPLQINAEVSEIARQHSRDMANGRATFSHDGFEGRVKAIAVTLPYKGAAENLAYLKGYPDLATTAVQGWINSPGHQKNMVGEFNITGIGIAKNAAGEYYFTQLFVLKR